MGCISGCGVGQLVTCCGECGRMPARLAAGHAGRAARATQRKPPLRICRATWKQPIPTAGQPCQGRRRDQACKQVAWGRADICAMLPAQCATPWHTSGTRGGSRPRPPCRLLPHHQLLSVVQLSRAGAAAAVRLCCAVFCLQPLAQSSDAQLSGARGAVAHGKPLRATCSPSRWFQAAT